MQKEKKWNEKLSTSENRGKDKLRNLDTLYIMSRQILRLNTHIADRYIMPSVLQFLLSLF